MEMQKGMINKDEEKNSDSKGLNYEKIHGL